MASLNLRVGALGTRLAGHLLRRSTFKVTIDRINEFALLTADQAVNNLFVIPPLWMPDGPISWNSNIAWLASQATYGDHGGLGGGARKKAVLTWLRNEALMDGSIRHKLVLFYTAIFTARAGGDPDYFLYRRRIQHYAMGSIKTMAYKITLDQQMLKYLDNDSNTAAAPNENYAREFLELFTIGKGPVIGVGNYTNYTEADIAQAAKVLTGFRTNYTEPDPDSDLTQGYATYSKHDTSDKQFSAELGGILITGAIDTSDMFRELEEFIDMVFGQLETARSFIRRLYRFFVSDIINAEIETDIIEPLAETLLDNDYDIEVPLKELLKSKHFYDEDDSISTDEIIGGKIKSPWELLITTANMLEASQLDPVGNPYDTFGNKFLDNMYSPMGFGYNEPLTVEGYPGFFKGSSYSKNWFSPSNMYYRYTVGLSYKRGKVRNSGTVIPYLANFTELVRDRFVNQDQSSELVGQVLAYFLPELPEVDRFDFFLSELLGGLSPINWMFEWQDYISSGDASGVSVGLENLYDAIFSSPEFQTF